MTDVNKTFVNFVGGELCPSVKSRYDIKVYGNGCERLENFILETQGPARFRTGSVYVHHTRRDKLARFVPFQFSDKQAYLIEATPGFFRFYKDEGIIVNDDKTITGMTFGNPIVVTCPAHGYNNDDEIFIYDTVGTVGINGKSYIVKNKTTDTFELYDIDEAAVDGAAHGSYTSGGVCNKIVEVATPYVKEEDLANIQFSQNADTMYCVHPDYPPRKLTRSSHTSWTFNTYTRTADPFTGANKYPGAVSFDGAGRILYGGTYDKPETIYASRGPATDGAQRYDDMTTGTLANDGFLITLAPVQGKVDSIQWLAANNKYFLIGTFSGLSRLVSPNGPDEPFSAETPPAAKPIDAFGCERVQPIPRGNLLFYLQRNSLILRSLEYDLVYNSYKSADKNLVADHITGTGIKELIFQHNRPDCVWCVRKDGVLLGLTYHETEDVSGWHRHTLGGAGKVISVGVMPRANGFDQLWVIVERYINGKTRRYVEFFADPVKFPTLIDFYTSEENKEEDKARWANVMFERQKWTIHLDSSLSYDGTLLGTEMDASVAPAATTGVNILFTSDKDIFEPDDLDRQIWKLHDDLGYGSGRAVITEYIDAKNVKCKIIKDFDNVDTLLPGEWTITASEVSGLDHLEGENVYILADGAVHEPETVENGKVNLSYQASVIHIGYRYRGLLKTMNIEAGGVSGAAQNKPRNVNKVVFRFIDTLGAKFGTDLYGLSAINFRSTEHYTNRPSPLFTGAMEKYYEDVTANEKYLYVAQDSPLPCVIQAIDVFMEAVDE